MEEFLETKRQIFPRFYFLSNDELLEILGQSKNARAVQPHMRKCFDAITGLEFGDQASGAIDIFAMISPQGEKVQLTKNLKARGPVEEWLLEVQQSMKKSLHDLFKQGNTKAKWSEYRVYGKHCSFDFYYSSLFQTCFIVFITFSFILKHPNKSFFNVINIWTTFTHTVLLYIIKISIFFISTSIYLRCIAICRNGSSIMDHGKQRSSRGFHFSSHVVPRHGRCIAQ